MNKTHLIFLHKKAVLDEIFLREISDTFSKSKDKFLIFHEDMSGNKIETWFQTKRISAHLSENMVANNAFSAEHKNLIAINNDLVAVKSQELQNLWKFVNVLILNGIASQRLVTFLEFASQIVQEIRFDSILFFPMNPLSPLASETCVPIVDEASFLKWKEIYPEEEKQLELCAKFYGTMASSKNFIYA